MEQGLALIGPMFLRIDTLFVYDTAEVSLADFL